MSLKVIVAEKEELLRNILIKELEQIEGIEVIYTTDNGSDLLNALKIMKPQIAIIDIAISELNGIKVGGIIREEQPDLELIYLSTSLNYIKEAIKLYATDYIEKPVSTLRLQCTLERIKHKFNVIEKIVQLRADGGYQVVKKNDIYLIEAIDKKTKIYTSTESFVCDHSLKEMEKLLYYRNFFRSSRSNIINLEKIKEIKPYTRTSYEVVFNNKNFRGYLSKKMHNEYKEIMKNYCVIL